jgi:predicted MFS family arabinose efflux permease|tara:strand:+ start:4378 stop:5607 length:1230 start_codon:yes stop_codon:yes gene_type:complete
MFAGDNEMQKHDGKTSLEFRTVLILALSFGLVGLDRFMISTLFPVIAKDLSLDYRDIGTITGSLAIAWGISALFMGSLSDRIGRRKVLVGALIAFSVLIGASGLATGLISLVFVRALMGFADGAYVPASIAETMEASPPQRSGRNVGLQQVTALLFGLGLAPLLIPPLLHVVDWRWIFVLIAIPGFICAWLTYKILPARPTRPSSGTMVWADWLAVTGYGNIRICMALMLAWLTCLTTISAFLPNYMLDHLGLTFSQMGTVMSAIGFGSATGTVILPWMSDRLGRKTIMLAGTAIIFVALVLLAASGPAVPHLFICLFFVMFGTLALITLTVGPLCAESVPPKMMATASGVVIATGELFGGGLAPILAGTVAQHWGIDHVLWLPIGVIACAFLLCTQIQPSKMPAVAHV